MSREHNTTDHTCWCDPTVEQVTVKSPKPDWSLFVGAMRAVEGRRALIADVDLPAEYAKAAARVIPDLLGDLDYARAEARNWHQAWESASRDVERQRQWLNEASASATAKRPDQAADPTDREDYCGRTWGA